MLKQVQHDGFLESLAPNQIPTFDNHDMHPLQAPLRTN
jgi:hypothetical protein